MAPAREGDTPLVLATKATLATLRDHDRLPPERAALAQLCLSLAAAIDGGARNGRASAVAMAAAQLRETMLVLDPPPEDSDAGAEAHRLLGEFMTKLDAAAEAGQPPELRAVR
jgi:hypothetical protein